MRRRSLLCAPLVVPLTLPFNRAAAAPALNGRCRLATAWRLPGATAPTDGFCVGILDIDWTAGQIQLRSQLRLPTRAHGLVALPDGGFVAVANRPGPWLLRCDAEGALLRLLDTAMETPQRGFNGHVEASAGGDWIYSSETDPATGAGWVSVRDARTLQRVAQFSSGGIDPHDLRLGVDGSLMLANGGIVRNGLGGKVEGERMAPNLARIDPASGRLLGRWTLPDTQLSLRHMAWSTGPTGAAAPDALLGVALQAEHDSTSQRAVAPALAIWDGQSLRLPCSDPRAGGYAGDIAAGPAGGFVVSAQKQGRALWWHPQEAQKLTLVAELTEPCALLPAADGAGVDIGAARGAARWHLRQPPRMLAWPVAMTPDNHAVLLHTG